MGQQPVSLREHLSGFSAVELPLSEAARHYLTVAGRFGRTSTIPLVGLPEGLQFLLPVKSFTTRYLLIDAGAWTVIVTDMRGEFCYVDAYALSRLTRCRGIGVVVLPERRQLRLFESGKKVREVQSESDFTSWYYREVGEVQPCEDAADYTKRRKRDRLMPEAVAKCWRRFTGQDLPTWVSFLDTRMVGIQRSTSEVKYPIIEYETTLDLFC